MIKFRAKGSPAELEALKTLLESIDDIDVRPSEVFVNQQSSRTGWRYFTVYVSNHLLPSSVVPVTVFQRRKRGAPKAKEGWVYLLKADNGTYKIGKTTNPHSRKRTFGVRLPFAVEYLHLIQTDDIGALERALHEKFAAKRLRGSEFFALTDEDVAFIRSL